MKKTIYASKRQSYRDDILVLSKKLNKNYIDPRFFVESNRKIHIYSPFNFLKVCIENCCVS